MRAIVVGGSSGIGLATAQAFASLGATVVATGRDQDKLDNALAGTGVTGQVLDATDTDAVRRFFTGEPIDHLVLALSGGLGGGPFATLELHELRTAFDGKFWLHLAVLQAALPDLTREASVTFVSAASARAAMPGTAGLAAVNGALEAMVGPLASELAPMRVNAVSPGIVDTPWWDGLPAADREALFTSHAATLPVGRIGRPEQIAHAIVSLATNGFVTGSILEVAGGLHLANPR